MEQLQHGKTNGNQKSRVIPGYTNRQQACRHQPVPQSSPAHTSCPHPSRSGLEEQGNFTRAEGPLFELQNLQIGMVAPNIEGTDVDDESFQLADYRGKVVVIDFWGDW